MTRVLIFIVFLSALDQVYVLLKQSSTQRAVTPLSHVHFRGTHPARTCDASLTEAGCRSAALMLLWKLGILHHLEQQAQPLKPVLKLPNSLPGACETIAAFWLCCPSSASLVPLQFSLFGLIDENTMKEVFHSV